MEEYPEPTPEEVSAYEKISPGTAEYVREHYKSRLRIMAWFVLTAIAFMMVGALVLLAVLLAIGML